MAIIKKLGFTVTELIIVIVILGIIGLFVFSADFSGTSTNLYAQVTQLTNDIRYTQSLSMARHDRYRLTTTLSGYTITDSAGNVKSTATLGSGMSFTTTNIIVFSSKGIPYINDTTPLTSAMTITLQTPKDSVSLFIAPTTGRVTTS